MGTREVSLSELALCLGDFGRRLVGRQQVEFASWGLFLGSPTEKLPTKNVVNLFIVGSKSLERLGELVYSW